MDGDAQETLLDGFLAYDAAVLGSAANTVRNHRIYLAAYLRWWQRTRGAHDLATATPGDVSGFLVAEAARGIGARTRRAQIAAIRRFYGWLLLRGLCPANPAALVPSPKAAPLHTDIYSPDQVARILAHTASLTDVRGRQRHVIVATLRHTGMRSGELRTLRRDGLDLARGTATVYGKGARQRLVLLANAHTFVTTPEHGFGTGALALEVELAGIGAGVPGRHFPHKWRHTYATELVRAGVDIHVVQRLLGHRHIASTVGYTHLALEDLRAAVGELWGAA